MRPMKAHSPPHDFCSTRLAGPFVDFLAAGFFVIVANAVCLANSEETSASASQAFRISVPTSSQVAVPPADSEITNFDASTGEFPEQVWSLQSNSPNGLVASFSVSEAFTHEDYPSIQHDARLRLRVAQTTGNGTWLTTIQDDVTHEASGDGQASVQVESNAPGRASVALKVSLVDDFQTMTQGRYSTTVVVTVSMP